MASRRIERLNEQFKREITGLVRSEVRDPRVGMATITGVETSADLSVARVYVSVLGSPEEKEENIEGLRAAASFIRTELGRRLHLRRIPELRFVLDRSIEYAQRIDQLLHEAFPDRWESLPGEEDVSNESTGDEE